MATNTIAGANLAQIAEETLPALTSCFAPLNGVVTDLSGDILNEGESVTVRTPTKAAAVDLSSGYTSQNTTLTAKTVTLNQFRGWVWGFKDAERSKSAIALNDAFIAPALDALGTKIFSDLWDLIVNANFSTSSTIAAGNFDRESLVDVGTTLTDTKKAPKMDRTLWCNPTYYGALTKTLNSAEFPGNSPEKAERMVPRTASFNVYETDLADANSENLAAFAFHKSALLMAARSVDAEGAREKGVEVEDILVPGLNLPIQWRKWYDENAGELKYSVGLLYGVAVGNDMGIRVVSS